MDIVSTMKHMMEYFIPEDSESSDSLYHKSIGQLAVEPLVDTLDGVEFTKEEILAVLEKFDPSKTPGEDDLNSNIILRIFKRFPTFFTEKYKCLRKGYFPKQWKRSIIIPIVKPGKAGSTEVTKISTY